METLINSKKLAAAATVFVLAGASVGPATAQSPKIGDPPEARNMRLVGFDDLQARSSYQPTIHRRADGRYFAYIGHHGADKDNPKRLNRLNGQLELNGVSIIEVTDPAHPKLLAHIPGDEGEAEAGGSSFVRVCDA